MDRDKHSKLTMDYWDDRATKSHCDAVCSGESMEEIGIHTEEHLDWFRSLLDKSMTVLDYGCGYGRLAKHVAGHVDMLICADVSKVMLNKAMDYLSDCSNISYHQADSKTLGIIPDNYVDFIYSVLTHQHIPRQYSDVVVKEWGRVLKPGGILFFQVCGDHHQGDDNVPDTNVWRSRKYREADLRRQVDEAGLTVNRFETIPSWYLLWCKKRS